MPATPPAHVGRRTVLGLLAGVAASALPLRPLWALPDRRRDVRALGFVHTHTGETLDLPYFEAGHYLAGGLDAVLSRPDPGRSRWWAVLILRWVTAYTPADFGFVRSRWTCEAVALVLREDWRVRVSRETVRRRLRAAGLVWRRPRPVRKIRQSSIRRKQCSVLLSRPGPSTTF